MPVGLEPQLPQLLREDQVEGGDGVVAAGPAGGGERRVGEVVERRGPQPLHLSPLECVHCLDAGNRLEIAHDLRGGVTTLVVHIQEDVDQLGTRDAYFWATHQGAELDLLVLHRGRRLGFEVKLSDAPRPSRSMRVASDDLGLDSLWVVHPGFDSWPMGEGLEAVAFGDLMTRLDEM